MKHTRKLWIPAVCAGLVLSTVQVAWANVFAAHLSAPATWNSNDGPVTLQYRLNQPATSVTIEIYRASAPATVVKTITGTTSYGLNSVQWDGSKDGGGFADSASDYKFRVIAVDATGFSGWTNITPIVDGKEIGSAQYYAPVGLTADVDQNSPRFGTIYVCNSESALTSTNQGATAVGDGIFSIHNDMTFTGGSAAASFIGIPVTNTTSTLSPWKININPDNSDEIVVSDFSTGYENVWIVQIGSATVNRTLDASTTGPGTGSNQNHGNAISAWIQGTGGNRRLWIIDEDFDAGTINPAPAAGDDVLRFDIGNTLVNFTGAPFEVVNGSTNPGGADGINYSNRDIAFGQISGHLYMCNRRFNAGNAEMAVARYSLDANGKVNGTVWSLSNNEITAAVGFTWNRTYAVAVDEYRNVVAVGRDESSPAAGGGGQIVIIDATTGSVLTSFHSGAPNDSYSFRDLAWDAAGNLITGNQWDEHVRMWSPPGPNSYTTSYYGTIDATINACNDTTPPAIVSAVSQRTHGLAGTFSVNLPTGVENRSGTALVVVTFDENVAGAGGLDPTDISVTSTAGTPAVNNPSIAGTVLSFNLTPMPATAKITLGFPGIVDGCNNAVTATRCLQVLTGDVNGDGNVNIFDMVTVRNNLSAAIGAGNFRSDVTADGNVNIFDLVTTRNNLGGTLVNVLCP